ncbi:MAG: FlgD immunoglobulin-like domain containing protein [bacterium]
MKKQSRRPAGGTMIPFGAVLAVLALHLPSAALAVGDGFDESFISTLYRDTAWTTATWDTITGEVRLPPLGLAPRGVYNTPGNAFAGAIVAGHLLVADGSAGLLSFAIADPDAPLLVDTGTTADQARDIDLAGDHAYLAIGAGGLQIFSVGDPANLVAAGVADVPGFASGVAVAGNWAYIAQSNLGVAVVGVSDPQNPVHVRDVSTLDWARGIAVTGQYLAVADGIAGLTILDASVPDDPVFAAGLDTDGTVLDVTVAGNVAYLAAGAAGLITVDLTDPTSPGLLDALPLMGTCRHATVRGDTVFVASGSGGLYLVDGSDPADLAILARSDTAGEAYHISQAGGPVWLCDGVEGIKGFTADPLGLDPLKNQARSLNINSGSDPVARASLTADFSDSVAFQLSVDGGVTWTPTPPDGSWIEFASPGADFRWRATLHQTGPYPGPILRQVSLVYEWLLDSAEILGVGDIPGDEGLQVRVTWAASRHDTVGATDQVTEYSLYRRFPPGKAYPPGSWDYLATIPADGEREYSLVAPTLADSSASGTAWTAFFVRARTGTAAIFFDSPVDSGYSVNNLRPAPPTGFWVAPAAGSGHDLGWHPSPLANFSHFALYRAADPATPPQPGTLLAVSLQTSYSDPAPGTWYYKLTVVDTEGRESDPVSAGDPSAAPPAPFDLALAGHPNPFNSLVTLTFAVPYEGAEILVDVFDTRGRAVRTLRTGPAPAGAGTVIWDARDAGGRPVPSGLYLCRIRCDGREQVRGLSLVR